jgi:hypothetical protein
VIVEADATRTGPVDLDALRTTIQMSGAEATPFPPTPNAPESDWFAWGRLNAPHAAIVVLSPMTLPADGLRAYGAHSEEGATLCIANHSELKVQVDARIRLPRGVYSIERLTLAPPIAVAREDTEIRTTRMPSSPPPVVENRLEWLEGRDLAAEATVEKSCLLEPGQVCLLRYTEEATAVHLALAEVSRQLHTLAARAPSTTQRLRRLLQQGDFTASALRAGGGRTRHADPRLARIHRMLLIAAQVLSVQRNNLDRNTIPAEAGTGVRAALESLTDALGQTSATLLGLVPRIVVEPSASGTQDAGAAGQRVTIALTNTGSRSVAMVKIGLDNAALLPGIVCRPADPAFFGTLRPGQTVRATFELQGPAATAVPNNRCVGDISYFAASAPAHLHLHPW